MNNAAQQTSADPAWAWAPYTPGAGAEWTLRQAGHLYRRAAFGGTWEQLQAALSNGPQRAVDKLLRPPGDTSAFNNAHDEYERAAAQGGSANNAAAWWLRRMIETPHPLLEQLTLFWHNYFGLSNARLNRPAMLCHYLHGLRRQALGKFDALLEGVLHEPALFVALEARANRKTRPDSDFARVILEQFTLGPGQYSKADVQAVARAFTGWFVSQDELRYIAREHTGEVEQVLHLVLRPSASARLVVRRLYRWLLTESGPAPESLLDPLVANFAKDYDLTRLVETMLRSNLFYSPAAYRQKVKSPIEFAVGMLRATGATVGTLELEAALTSLGQDLYEPPTIKGWAGHRAWLNRLTLLGRANLAQALLSEPQGYHGNMDVQALAQKHGFQTPATATEFLCELFVQGDLPEKVRQSLTEAAAGKSSPVPNMRLGQIGALLAALPEFQLA